MQDMKGTAPLDMVPNRPSCICVRCSPLDESMKVFIEGA